MNKIKLNHDHSNQPEIIVVIACVLLYIYFYSMKGAVPYLCFMHLKLFPMTLYINECLLLTDLPHSLASLQETTCIIKQHGRLWEWAG